MPLHQPPQLTLSKTEYTPFHRCVNSQEEFRSIFRVKMWPTMCETRSTKLGWLFTNMSAPYLLWDTRTKLPWVSSVTWVLTFNLSSSKHISSAQQVARMYLGRHQFTQNKLLTLSHMCKYDANSQKLLWLHEYGSLMNTTVLQGSARICNLKADKCYVN